MTINEHLAELAGRPVADFPYEHDGESSERYFGPGASVPHASPGEVDWRIRTWFDGPGFGDVFQKFLMEVSPAEVTPERAGCRCPRWHTPRPGCCHRVFA